MFPLSERNHASAVTAIVSLFVREWKSKPRESPLPSAMPQQQEGEDFPASCQPSALCSGTWNSEALSLLAASPMVFSPRCSALTLSMPSLSFHLSYTSLISFSSLLWGRRSALCTELSAFLPSPTLPLTGRPVQVPLPSPASPPWDFLPVELSKWSACLVCSYTRSLAVSPIYPSRRALSLLTYM